MKHFFILFSTILYLFSYVEVRADNLLSKVKMDRLRKIGFYHLGVATDIYGINNLDCGITFLTGFGSSRNLLNLDFGVGYEYTTNFLSKSSSAIHGHRIPVSLSILINVLRHERNCMYIGGEYAYHFTAGSVYKNSNNRFSDKSLLCNYSSATVKIGYRWNIIDLSLRCRYAINPKFNQKYIYETETYDFDALKKQIYNRWQFGIVLIYYFRFGL